MTDEVKNILRRNNHRVLADSTLKNRGIDWLIGYIRTLENNWSVALWRCDNQARLFEKKSYYDWHDLRKNPCDVPEQGKWIIATNDGKNYFCGNVFYGNAGFIAWKYIEPLEM